VGSWQLIIDHLLLITTPAMWKSEMWAPGNEYGFAETANLRTEMIDAGIVSGQMHQ
jgi:hypothetical protein